MEKQGSHVWVCMVLLLIATFVSPSSGQQFGCRYRITTQTTNRVNAGSTARIRLTLCRAQHDCFINVLDLSQFGDNGPNYGYFGRGSLDHFTITTRQECYTPCQILIGHDNGGARPRWLVDYIDVEAFNPAGVRQSRTRFPFYQWVNRGATVTINRCPIKLDDVDQSQARDTLLRQYVVA